MNNSEVSTSANRFIDRVAVISGASSGIGRAVAERLAAEGAKLVLIAAPSDSDDLESVLEALRASGEADGMAADITDPGTAERAVDRALSQYGRLDVLVNNAGIAYYEEALSTPVEHLDRTLAVNVRGMFSLSVAAAKAMASRGGAIVNTASTASFVGEEFQVTYNASKAAVVALTRSLAIDLARFGIRVNAVAPGWVETRATAPVIADVAQWSKHRSRIPLDRAASPAEIAAVHAFLASDDASYVTGAVYLCDGGMTAGNRYSGWEATEPPEGGFTTGIPQVPVDMHGTEG
jgi:NAD(P)-dependent dehydrogenase (short-subunit alcohol dehydrogenase family)